MGFDGSAVLRPLDYKGMSEWGVPDGTIAEPSNEKLLAFFDAVSALASNEGEASGEELLSRAHQATSELCSGIPSAEQFAALPPRLFREFAKWLASEFTDPKG